MESFDPWIWSPIDLAPDYQELFGHNPDDQGVAFDIGYRPSNQSDEAIFEFVESPTYEVDNTGTHIQHELSTAGIVSDETSPFLPLKQWIEGHPGVLYPTSTAKTYLSGIAGLSVKQVSTWFSNYRQRMIKPTLTCPADDNSQDIGINQTYNDEDCRSDLPEYLRLPDSKSSYQANAASSSRDSLSANESIHSSDEPRNKVKEPSAKIGDLFNTFRSSFTTIWIDQQIMAEPYEQLGGDELNHQDRPPASPRNRRLVTKRPCRIGPDFTASEMMDSYQRMPPSIFYRVFAPNCLYCSTDSTSPTRKARTTHRREHKMKYRNSVHSSTSSQSEASGQSASSVSIGQTSSVNSYSSRDSRRGRRIQTQISRPPTYPPTPSVLGRTFYCTDCSQSFTRKSALIRHRNAVHTAERWWVCHPRLGKGSPKCLCGSPSMLACEHRMLGCWIQDENRRTFYRPDAFKRHLSETHRLGSIINNLNLKEFEFSRKPG